MQQILFLPYIHHTLHCITGNLGRLHYSALNKGDPINYLCKAHNSSVFSTLDRRDVYTPVEYTPELGGTLAHPLLLSPPGMGGGTLLLLCPPGLSSKQQENCHFCPLFSPSPLLTGNHRHPHPIAERHLSLIYILENLF